MSYLKIVEGCIRRVAQRARETMPEDTTSIALFEELAMELSKATGGNYDVSDPNDEREPHDIFHGEGGLGEFGFCTRATRALMAAGIVTIEALCLKRMDDIMKLPGMGTQSALNVVDCLRERGFCLFGQELETD